MPGPTRRAALAMGAAATLAASPRLARAQASQQLAIATGTTGGVYYPLGGAMANMLSRGIPGMSATVEVTGGSVANIQLLGAEPGRHGRSPRWTRRWTRCAASSASAAAPCRRAPSPCSTPTACRW